MYITLDCEFNEKGLVREVALLLFKDNQILRLLEVLISKTGSDEVDYNPSQNNYHIRNPDLLTVCINEFLESCTEFAPLSDIKIVGMSLDNDLKCITKTTKQKTNLSQMAHYTQLEMCGRGTLEAKALNNNITKTQTKRVIELLTSARHKKFYKYHTALYDAIVTGYVYLRIIGDEQHITVHPRFKSCNHSYFEEYHQELHQAKNKPKIKHHPSPGAKVPKNFPEMRYRLQRNISSVFDVVARDIFYHQLTRLRYEPSIKRINFIKENIMKDVYVAKCSILQYDTQPSITDPYNFPLVHAGRMLAEKKISPEDFIDFAIYMQQYNLPKHMGTYYKVYNSRKEIYVRCLQSATAKKLLTKLPYATVEQFLRKEIPECYIEKVDC
ncbi:MAG: hypothetical protein ATN34_01095 [Epulopiscium sp. Nele67-Bin002]|nr:MAG: hypothetical protein ATN34_01095 [Epulopiscium sp. Nele67-Bin002]OON91654.1 MAG: hypothetical protein ATN33_00795 [Epulopiscium sp. Nele67-Bin001]